MTLERGLGIVCHQRSARHDASPSKVRSTYIGPCGLDSSILLRRKRHVLAPRPGAFPHTAVTCRAVYHKAMVSTPIRLRSRFSEVSVNGIKC
jgi:hypothetical protein